MGPYSLLYNFYIEILSMLDLQNRLGDFIET